MDLTYFKRYTKKVLKDEKYPSEADSNITSLRSSASEKSRPGPKACLHAFFLVPDPTSSEVRGNLLISKDTVCLRRSHLPFFQTEQTIGLQMSQMIRIEKDP